MNILYLNTAFACLKNIVILSSLVVECLCDLPIFAGPRGSGKSCTKNNKIRWCSISEKCCDGICCVHCCDNGEINMWWIILIVVAVIVIIMVILYRFVCKKRINTETDPVGAATQDVEMQGSDEKYTDDQPPSYNDICPPSLPPYDDCATSPPSYQESHV